MACLSQTSVSPIVLGKSGRVPAASPKCQASLRKGPQFTQFLQLDDSHLQVFRDESKGIVCYRTPTGEITCEGIDEGPHFQPSMDNHNRIYLSQLLFEATKSANEEPLVNGAGI